MNRRDTNGMLWTDTCNLCDAPLQQEAIVGEADCICATCRPAPRAVSSLTSLAQLWEPCERCGSEPSYLTPHGHLCASHARRAHPRIPGPGGAPYHTTEPDGA